MLSKDTRRLLARRKIVRKAWEKCESSEALLRWAGDVEVPRPALVRGACACARLALKHVPESEPRPLRAIEKAEAWTRGEAKIEEVRAAADSARAAAYAAYAANAAARTAAYAAYAAYAANAAARTAASAASAARTAANAASAAWAAARDAAARDAAARDAAAAREGMLLECAQTVRATIGWPVVAFAHEKAGLSLGETWLETVAATCGVNPKRLRDLSFYAESTIVELSREMAEKGRWEPIAFLDFWQMTDERRYAK